MRTNPEGDVILTETEQQTILEGMRLLSLYCENLTGCQECPFCVDNGCDLKSWLPCAWTIPERWDKSNERGGLK